MRRASARRTVLSMIVGSPAWNPHAIIEELITSMIDSSSPMRYGPNPAPMAAHRPMFLRTARAGGELRWSLERPSKVMGSNWCLIRRRSRAIFQVGPSKLHAVTAFRVVGEVGAVARRHAN